MNDSCGVAITLRHVVTRVEPRGGGSRPVPILEPWFTVPAVAQMFDVSLRRVYNVLSTDRRRLEPPRYRQRRAYGDFRLRRILSERDVQILSTILLRCVKR